MGLGSLDLFHLHTPGSSVLSKSGQCLSFETLQSEFVKYAKDGWVLLCGDFNARHRILTTLLCLLKSTLICQLTY